MRFDNLPAELVAKIMAASDRDTFHSIQELSTTTFKISKCKMFENIDNTDKIILDGPDCFVGFINGSRKLVATTNQVYSAEERRQWTEFRNKVVRVKSIEISNVNFVVSLAAFIFPMRFPNLKIIEKFEFVNDSRAGKNILSRAELMPFLKKYCVQLIKYVTTSREDDLDFDDETIRNINDMEVSGPCVGISRVTDATLERIYSKRRKVFKLLNVKTGFSLATLSCVVKKAVSHNLEVDWNLGYILCSETERKLFDKMPHYKKHETSNAFIKELTDLKSYIKARGFTWTREVEREDLHGYKDICTIKICKDKTKIEFSVNPLHRPSEKGRKRKHRQNAE